MRRHHFGASSLIAVVALFCIMGMSACNKRVTDLTIEIDGAADVVAITVRNSNQTVREVDDQFLRDYSGAGSAIQLSMSRDGNSIDQCRSMDYFGPPKVSQIKPGDKVVLRTHVSALIHVFCLDEPGSYFVGASLTEPGRGKVLSNTAAIVVDQKKIDHQIRPSDSTR